MAGYIGKSQSVSLSSVSTNTVETQDIQDGAVTNSKYGGAIDVNASAPADSVNIDSSGNFLVGKTSSAIETVGTELKTDRIYSTRDGGQPLALNRKTSDGEIVTFHKDATEIGNIGSVGGSRIYIESKSGAGIYLRGGDITPRNVGANSDGTIDIGYSTLRWKDLYLSGGVYLGGTGSANYLDDYEEGTWTPSVNWTTVSVGVATGKYIKIGQLVHFQARLSWGSATGMDGVIRGLPFTAIDGSNASYSMTVVPYVNSGLSLPSGKGYAVGFVQANDTYIYFTWQPNTTDATFESSGNVYISGQYYSQ